MLVWHKKTSNNSMAYSNLMILVQKTWENSRWAWIQSLMFLNMVIIEEKILIRDKIQHKLLREFCKNSLEDLKGNSETMSICLNGETGLEKSLKHSKQRVHQMNSWCTSTNWLHHPQSSQETWILFTMLSWNLPRDSSDNKEDHQELTQKWWNNFKK